MTTPTPVPVAATRLVRVAALLVPAPLRDDWRREWAGELAAWSSAGHAGATRHALGAFADAFWLRQRHAADAGWVDDLRHGWRQLRGHAGFAAIAIGILALGMAGSIAAFSVVSQVLLRPLPYPEPDRLVTLWERQPTAQGRLDVAPGNFLDWRDRASSFTALAAADPYSRDYADAERPEVWRMLNVTAGFFDALGERPLLGRTFTAEEHTRGRHQVVVISAGLWRSRFAADAAAIGRRIRLDGEAWTIVGVMPDDFLPYLQEATPGSVLAWAPKYIEEFEPRIRASGYWNVVGRLKPGVTLAQARGEMDRIAIQIEAEQPRTNRGSRVELVTMREHLVGDVRAAVGLFAAAVGVVLLIACVNVTNLLLARGATRATELAVRSALGASRRRLVGQLFVENLQLAVLAATAALALAAAAIRALARFGPTAVPWVDSLHLDWRAAGFAATLSVVVAGLAGVVPALRLSGVGSGATRTATGDRGHRRLRTALVASEVALALILVSGAALLLKSFVNLVNVDAGFARGGVAALQMFAWDRNIGPDRLRGFFDAAIGNIAALPGVDAAGAVMALPFIESNIDVRGIFQIVGDPAPAPGEEPRASFNVATPGYFQVLSVPVVRGRGLDERDSRDSAPVAVIAEALAERYFRGRDPVGQRLELPIAGTAAAGGDCRRGRVAAPRAAGRAAAARDLPPVRAGPVRVDDRGRAHRTRPAVVARVGQAPGVGRRSAPGLPSHGDARRTGDADDFGAAFRADRAGRVRRPVAAAGRRRTVRRADRDCAAVPPRDRGAAGGWRLVVRHRPVDARSRPRRRRGRRRRRRRRIARRRPAAGVVPGQRVARRSVGDRRRGAGPDAGGAAGVPDSGPAGRQHQSQ